MPCYLRVYGEVLDIDSLLAQVKLEPVSVWHKGEPRSPKNPKSTIRPRSGASFLASGADSIEFECQVDEATAFLLEHQTDVTKIVTFPDTEGAILDFSIELQNVAIHSDYLPSKFLGLAGKAWPRR